MADFPLTIDDIRQICENDALAKWLNLQVEQIGPGAAQAHMLVEPKHIAPNGKLHAPVIMGMADFLCALATSVNLPGPQYTFATLEIKSNFLSSCGPGLLCCQAKARHLGNKTQVWDAKIFSAQDQRVLALFRCTQMLFLKDK